MSGKKGPRLWLRQRDGRPSVWIIRDRRYQQGTGCGESDIEGAERALAEYIAQKHQAPKTGGQLDKTAVADCVNLYLKEHAPKTKSLDFIKHTAAPIIEWWGDKTLARINAKTCTEYVSWRTAQAVSDQTARHDLKRLRAAIRYYNASEYGPLLSLPVSRSRREGHSGVTTGTRVKRRQHASGPRVDSATGISSVFY